MPDFNPNTYGPALADLLAQRPLSPLGPGSPHESVRSQLAALSADNFAGATHVREHAMATACLAGLWLAYDFLDESHAISQEIATPTGSYWHGILHRREPDFGNTAYWFRRVGKHPIFDALHQEAAALASDTAAAEAGFLKTQTAWDPFRFNAFCEASLAGQPASELLCRQIQHREWELLFDYSYRQAVG